MGNYRFRVSNIIPNSWLHKLKNSSTKKQPITTSFSSSTPAVDQRKSYYFTRDLTVVPEPDPPRKSSKKIPISPKKPIYRKLVSGELNFAVNSSCRITPESVWAESNSSDDETDVVSPELSLTCSCKTKSSYDDVYKKVNLPPIITKPVKQTEGIIGISRSPVRKFVKTNCYSPRIGNRVRVHGMNGGGGRRSNGRRRNLSESMAVVKITVDPGRDFKESMVEMIMENNMKSSKDLEDLLACYLSLNSDEYHELIIKVFKQIWFEL